MFEMMNPSQSVLILQSTRLAHDGSPAGGQALKLFRSAQRIGELSSLWTRIFSRSNSLLDLD